MPSTKKATRKPAPKAAPKATKATKKGRAKPAAPKAAKASKKAPAKNAAAPPRKPTPRPAPSPKAARPAAAKVAKAPRAPKAPKKAAAPGLSPAARQKRLQAFRERLVGRHRQLVHNYSIIKGDSRDLTSDGTEDYIDYAVSSYSRDFTLSLTELERGQIRLIEEALTRLDRDEFGRCLQCGQPIPDKRLEVEPWARHCIRCQELEEQGLLQEQRFEHEFDDADALIGEGTDDLGEGEEAEKEEEEILEPDDEPETVAPEAIDVDTDEDVEDDDSDLKD